MNTDTQPEFAVTTTTRLLKEEKERLNRAIDEVLLPAAYKLGRIRAFNDRYFAAGQVNRSERFGPLGVEVMKEETYSSAVTADLSFVVFADWQERKITVMEITNRIPPYGGTTVRQKRSTGGGS